MTHYPTPGNLCQRMTVYVHTKTFAWKFIAVLFLTAQTWKLPKCLLTGEWRNTFWHIHKDNILFSNKNEWTSDRSKNTIALKIIVLSEKCQMKQRTQYDRTHVKVQKTGTENGSLVAWDCVGAGGGENEYKRELLGVRDMSIVFILVMVSQVYMSKLMTLYGLKTSRLFFVKYTSVKLFHTHSAGYFPQLLIQ